MIMVHDSVFSTFTTQSRLLLLFLYLSLISWAALFVPALPAHPLDLSHPTSLGVTAAVTPTLTGKNNVLCTVYASATIAHNPSEPAPCTAPAALSMCS